MADRIFGAVMLLLALGYGSVALGIRAPFQYDPLGPESWPRVLAVALGLAAIFLLVRPGGGDHWGRRSDLGRVAVTFLALVVYALVFEPLGFVLSTLAFTFGIAVYEGCRPGAAAIYAVGLGLGGYLISTRVLELNLPAGLLPL